MRLFIGLQWLRGGFMGLVSRKEGVQRYYYLHHQATGFTSSGNRAFPDSPANQSMAGWLF
jgi:hypothetical protein